MSVKPTLALQPVGGSSTDIIRCFAMGKPLSPEQVHFLDFHQRQLSSREFDPVLRYYLQKYHGENKHRASFLLPHEVINHEAIATLKKRLHVFLHKQPKKQAVIHLSQEQFNKFRELGMQELIFWHGNQLLTGAPMFQGGTPPVLFFQWGNYFGVVKYLVLAGEKSLKTNLLIYFEDRLDRALEQCVLDYNHRVDNEIKQQKSLLLENNIAPDKFNEFLIKTPVLRPSLSYPYNQSLL